MSPQIRSKISSEEGSSTPIKRNSFLKQMILKDSGLFSHALLERAVFFQRSKNFMASNSTKTGFNSKENRYLMSEQTSELNCLRIRALKRTTNSVIKWNEFCSLNLCLLVTDNYGTLPVVSLSFRNLPARDLSTVQRQLQAELQRMVKTDYGELHSNN